MTQTATNILISPVRVFYAPVGEALPSETTVEYGGDWGGGWVELGYTNAPLAWATEIEEYEVMAQQTTLPIARVPTAEHHALETTLMEITPDNISLGIPGTVTSVDAGEGQRAYEKLQAGGIVILPIRAWGFEGLSLDEDQNEFPARFFFYKATSKLNGSIEFAKDAESGIPLIISALADTSKAAGKQAFEFMRVTGEATG